MASQPVCRGWQWAMDPSGLLRILRILLRTRQKSIPDTNPVMPNEDLPSGTLDPSRWTEQRETSNLWNLWNL